jgi:hypothetical protein
MSHRIDRIFIVLHVNGNPSPASDGASYGRKRIVIESNLDYFGEAQTVLQVNATKVNICTGCGE